MKAIVLTYDDRAPYVDLVLSSYNYFWKNCPLEFVIPYNNQLPYYKDKFKNLFFIKTEKSVKKTMLTLLSNIPDKEFVYWCLDDVYLHNLCKLNALNNVYNFINNTNCNVDGIRLRTMRMKKGRGYKVGEESFYSINFTHYQFWFHYFVKSKVLKNIFFSDVIKNCFSIRAIGRERKKIKTPNYKILIPQNNIAVFGETTRNGIPTKNCQNGFNTYNIKTNIKKFSSIVILNNTVKRTK